jgi:hypothetical protein
MTTTTTRRQRYRRSTASREIRITHRALSTLRALARFRFLTIDQITTLLDIEQRVYDLPPVSRQKVSRLLRKLYDAGYIERVLGPVTNLRNSPQSVACPLRMRSHRTARTISPAPTTCRSITSTGS